MCGTCYEAAFETVRREHDARVAEHGPRVKRQLKEVLDTLVRTLPRRSASKISGPSGEVRGTRRQVPKGRGWPLSLVGSSIGDMSPALMVDGALFRITQTARGRPATEKLYSPEREDLLLAATTGHRRERLNAEIARLLRETGAAWPSALPPRIDPWADPDGYEERC
jgi:hypothetical protein